MKANGAPEKLYLLSNGLISYCRNTDEDIEYTRTDAFIEKALAYLNEKFYFNNLHYAIENNTFNCTEEMFEDFKKAMEL